MNALQNLLGHNSGQLTSWMLPIAVILAVVLPFYRMMKASTQLRDLAEDAMMANPAASHSHG
jgi:hypothetical protein